LTNVIIEKINAKKVFKGAKIKVMITTLTNISLGYDIVEVDNPDEAIADVENVIAPELIGYPATDIDFVDTLICESSVNNPIVTMGISISVARAASNSLDIPLFKFLGGALTTDLPIVASGILADKNNNELMPIVMAESVEDIVNLNRLDWNCLSDWSWCNHPDGKRTRMAEVLVPSHVSIDRLQSVICNSITTYINLLEVCPSDTEIILEQKFYF